MQFGTIVQHRVEYEQQLQDSFQRAMCSLEPIATTTICRLIFVVYC